jgi:hypothetical protein
MKHARKRTSSSSKKAVRPQSKERVDTIRYSAPSGAVLRDDLPPFEPTNWSKLRIEWVVRRVKRREPWLGEDEARRIARELMADPGYIEDLKAECESQ